MVLKDIQLTEYEHSIIDWGAELEFTSTKRLKQYTHRLYNRYPARSVSLVPRAILAGLRKQSSQNNPLRILDPFMGSGTTAVEATLQGMLPYGVEIDPFARLVSDVKVQAYSDDELKRLSSEFKLIATNWRDYAADENYKPRSENIEYWFDEKTFGHLLQLKHAIYDICGDKRRELNFFRLVFADIIRPCSKAERQTLKPYISKKYPKQPAEVSDTWTKSYTAYMDAVREYSIAVHSKSRGIIWLGRDAVSFTSEECSVDAAITSPPYINALDYVRCIKMESAWIDCGTDEIFAELRKGHVGEAVRDAEFIHPLVVKELEPYISQLSKVDKTRSRIVLNYFNDMFANLSRIFHVLRPNGEYHLIVGNSSIRGIYVPTHEILAALAQSLGFTWMRYYRYKIKDHRTSIPRNGQGGKIDVEHVISLRKGMD